MAMIHTKQGLAPLATAIIALVVIGLIVWAVMAGRDETDTDPAGGIQQTRDEIITVELREQNNSGEDGEATLTALGTSTVRVAIELDNATSTPQPAHIHFGACPNPGAILFPLNNVVNGTSTTDIAASLEALRAQRPLAINVHRSAAQPNVYVSCGDIAPTATSTATTTSETSR